MSSRTFTYMTFHRVRFSSPINAHSRSFAAPEFAHHWLFGSDSPLGDDGLRTRISYVWGGAAFYDNLRDAERVFANAQRGLLFNQPVSEAWHAIVRPISHRGKTNWFGPACSSENRIVPAQSDPGGPLLVVTSAGYNVPLGDMKSDLPRRLDFLVNVDRVRAWYATLPGVLALGQFNPHPIGTDGMTFSLWRDDAAMMAAAYQPGIHRAQLERYRNEKTADRTAFTRARILTCTGTWDGEMLAQ